MQWMWFVLTMVGFGLGLGWAFVRARRRLQARMVLELEQEIKRRVQAEMMQRLGASPEQIAQMNAAASQTDREASNG